METIKNYLENMFRNLPNTPEVYKAKQELLQMMEDKYMELKEEGKTENEAIGVVISEFGNLDEIAKELGIQESVERSVPEGKKLSLEEAKEYLLDMSHGARGIALGIFFVITSFIPPIICDGLVEIGAEEKMMDVLGGACFILLLAIGIGCIIYTNIRNSKWDKLDQECYVTEFATTDYVQSQWEVYRQNYATTKTLGVALCILSIVPELVADVLDNEMLEDTLGGTGLFLFIALGVFLLVTGANRKAAYMKLLHLNDPRSVGGKYTVDQKRSNKVQSPALKAVLSVFWPTVVCIYLSYSFLTFNWATSWVIFIIAAVLKMFLENLEGDEDNEA